MRFSLSFLSRLTRSSKHPFVSLFEPLRDSHPNDQTLPFTLQQTPTLPPSPRFRLQKNRQNACSSSFHTISRCFWSWIDLDPKDPTYKMISSSFALEQALEHLYLDIADAPDRSMKQNFSQINLQTWDNHPE